MQKDNKIFNNTDEISAKYCNMIGLPILNNRFVGFILTDNVGNIVFCNQFVEKLFNHTDAKIVNKNISIFIPELIINDMLKLKFPFDKIFEVHGIKENNDILYLEVTINELSDENEVKHLLFIVNDLTRQHDADIAKNDFISTVSHELRTPLTSVKGALDLLQYSVGESLQEGASNLLKIASNNSMRLLQLINDILDLQKIEAGKMDFEFENVELGSVVEQCISYNSSYAKKFSVNFKFDKPDKDFLVYADKTRLSQVITNFLSNAAKFSPVNDDVVIEITTSQKSNANFYRLSVKDKGEGVPADFQSKLFDKFSQIPKSHKEGTGLGLNICKNIIEKMNGSIGFCPLEVGSEFFFELPSVSETSKKILVCEDDETQAMFISNLFSENGYLVDIALSAENAKKMLSEKRYDLITVDIILPDQDGISLIKDVYFNSEFNKETPIIVISCIVDDYKVELINKFNIVDFYNKAFCVTSLLSRIKDICSDKEKINILHVEDDSDVLDVVRTVLDEVAVITPAMTFDDGVEQITNNKFDLVLLDINLPNASGLDLLPILNSCEEPTPVIIFSSLDVNENIAKNVSTVLLKSKISNEDLLRTIKSIIPANS